MNSADTKKRFLCSEGYVAKLNSGGFKMDDVGKIIMIIAIIIAVIAVIGQLLGIFISTRKNILNVLTAETNLNQMFSI